jgi:hypothetical protein
MSEPNGKILVKAPGILAAGATILLSLPAAIYAFMVWLPRSAGDWAASRPFGLALSNFAGLCGFIVVLGGRPLCLLAIIIDLVLIFLRGPSLRVKLIASFFVVLAIVGTVLIESQLQHSRH